MAWMKLRLLRKPRAVYLTHWTLALIDSLPALVMRCRKIGDDVLEPPLQHPSHFDHRLQSAARGPVAPPSKMLPRWPLVNILVESQEDFFQGPRPRCFSIHCCAARQILCGPS